MWGFRACSEAPFVTCSVSEETENLELRVARRHQLPRYGAEDLRIDAKRPGQETHESTSEVWSIQKPSRPSLESRELEASPSN